MSGDEVGQRAHTDGVSLAVPRRIQASSLRPWRKNIRFLNARICGQIRQRRIKIAIEHVIVLLKTIQRRLIVTREAHRAVSKHTLAINRWPTSSLMLHLSAA